MASNGPTVSGTTQAIPEGKNRAGLATRIAASNIQIRERPETEVEQEAGAQLKLGEFAAVPALSVSEARYLVETILSNRNKSGKGSQGTEIMVKMQNYMDTFARFKDRPQLDELESLMIPHAQLDHYERAQLLSLCPGDHEEAKTLIPSLTDKISDDELDQLLADIGAVRQR